MPESEPYSIQNQISIRWDVQQVSQINELYRKRLANGFKEYRRDNPFNYDGDYLNTLYQVTFWLLFASVLSYPLQSISMFMMQWYVIFFPVEIEWFYPDLVKWTPEQYWNEIDGAFHYFFWLNIQNISYFIAWVVDVALVVYIIYYGATSTTAFGAIQWVALGLICIIMPAFFKAIFAIIVYATMDAIFNFWELETPDPLQ